MTDTCATCRFYVSGDCRWNPPIYATNAGRAMAFRPTPDYWCGQFQDGTPGTSTNQVQISAAANATNTFVFYFRPQDGTLWVSTNNGSTWTQVTTP